MVVFEEMRAGDGERDGGVVLGSCGQCVALSIGYDKFTGVTAGSVGGCFLVPCSGLGFSDGFGLIGYL